MTRYEYKVVPAPTKGIKAKGVKTPEGRFANSVETVLNAQGADGWEYCRAELLPSDERVGLTGSTTNWRNVLVFRRLVGVLSGADIADIADVATGPARAGAVEIFGSAEADAMVADGSDAAGEAEHDVARSGDPMQQTTQETRAGKLITVSGMFAAQDARASQSAGQSDVADQSSEPKA